MTKHLFIVNGLGLGNSTRCQALIEQLHKDGSVVDIITSGNGLMFFEKQKLHRHLISQNPLHYGERFGWKTAFDVVTKNLQHLKANAKLQQDWMKREGYQQIWIDSDYSYLFWSTISSKITLINHAYFTILNFWQLPSPLLFSCFGHFIVELFDFLLSLYRSHEVLCPDYFPRQDQMLMGKVRLTSSLVRNMKPAERSEKKVVISLSGYSLPENMDLIARICQLVTSPIVVLKNARDVLPQLPPHVEVREKKFNDHDYLFEASALITNAGYSTLSEAIALNIPLILAPIPAHAEQQVNADRLYRAHVAKSLDSFLDEMECV